MTISSPNNRDDYLGTGTTGPFAYTFRIFAATDLYVVKRSTGGIETTLALTTDYSVTGVGNPAGGTISLNDTLATGERLAILAAFDLVQTTDLRNQGTFFPEDLEDALDYARSVDLQQQDQIDRSLKLPPSVNPADVDPTLPVPEGDKVIGWNSAGTALVNRAPGSGGSGAVSSVFGRTGAVAAQSGDYSVGQVTGAAPLASPALTGAPTVNSEPVASKVYVDAAVAAASSAVSSVFGRTGAVTKQAGDYAVSDITGAAPLASPALTGTPTAPTPTAADNSTKVATTAYVDAAVGAGTGAVSSVFGRTGAVVKQSGDYAVADVTGAAPLASPALTGNPTAPTQSAGNNSTRLATTAYVDTAVGAGTGAVASVFGRTGSVVKQAGDYAVADVTGAAPLASPALTGTPTAPTQSTSDNSTRLATTAFVKSIAFGGVSASDIPAYNVKASPYSAAGNGTTDDTAAFNAAIAACNAAGGGIVYVPPGTYMIDARPVSGLTHVYGIRLLSNVALIGAPGSTLKAITNGENGIFGVISGNNLSNLVIHGLTVIGERDTHTGADTDSSQAGMGLLLYQCSDVRVEDCVFQKHWADGIYLGSNSSGTLPCDDVVIQNCTCTANRRNGMSAVGCRNGVAIGCTFEDSGPLSALRGQDPQAGIDIEPNFTGECVNFKIIGCHSRRNGGAGYQFSIMSENARLINSIAEANQKYGVKMGGFDNDVDGCTVIDMTVATRGAIDVNSEARRSRIRNCLIQDNATGQPALYVHLSADDCEIDNVRIRNHDAVGMEIFGPNTKITNCYLEDIDSVGIRINSTATDSEVIGNHIARSIGRAIHGQARGRYNDNTAIDVSSVVNGFINITAAGSEVNHNRCILSTTNTGISGVRIDAAPASAIGNVQIGMQNINATFVTQPSEVRGDVNLTLSPDVNAEYQLFGTTLTANRTVTLSTTRAYNGARFSIVRTGLGAFTLNVGGLKTIPSATAARVDVYYNGTAWQIVGYQLL